MRRGLNRLRAVLRCTAQRVAASGGPSPEQQKMPRNLIPRRSRLESCRGPHHRIVQMATDNLKPYPTRARAAGDKRRVPGITRGGEGECGNPLRRIMIAQTRQ